MNIDMQLSLRLSRSKTHKHTLDLISGAGELRDLVNDPNETTNVFYHPENESAQAELTTLIHLQTHRGIVFIPSRVNNACGKQWIVFFSW